MDDTVPSVDRLVAPKLSTVDGVREVCELGCCTNDGCLARLRQRTRGDVAARYELPCDELSDYYRLVAVLEAQLRDEGCPRDDVTGLVEPLKDYGSPRTPATRARPKICRGALCASLARLATHGDDRVRDLVEGLLAKTSEPVRRDPAVGLLREIAAGPAGEFFVQETSDEDDFWAARLSEAAHGTGFGGRRIQNFVWARP